MASPESSEDSGTQGCAGGVLLGAAGAWGGSVGGAVREQDRFLPIANVSRIMKKALPGNAKISKEAKETLQECVSEFISFVTGEASDKCQREKRKTINGDDLLWAISTLGFEDYVDPLKLYLSKFRELEGERATNALDNNPPTNLSPPPTNLNANRPLPHIYSSSSSSSSSPSSSSPSLGPHLTHPNGAPSNGLMASTQPPLHPQGNMHLYHPPTPPQLVMQHHVQSSPPLVAPFFGPASKKTS
ncbi:hypothetical protein GOP47_0009953 [Adiantum capillus-veneris]|uniref:Transcription factor CBF/NF-Y/archaeal histone domain-containing protein n=1 Tax=Adiantum capillus-veneris TaxID=13818 RepID=A0A9D4ZJ68_ADICA|nr:hypothetical protein GOP47_0009501 [Adiantum capillus-veneris]KAI5075877.1 hypothetical protein GOP47_0009953 [Adiantum capillus-veneris]